MNTDKETIIKSLRMRGFFIALMGVLGVVIFLVCYFFQLVTGPSLWLTGIFIVLFGTPYCIIGAAQMFAMANDIKNKG